MEERTPLVVKNMELVPSTSNRFAKTSQPVVYVEVVAHDPALKGERPPYVGVLYNIIDRKTNQQVFSSNTMLVNDSCVLAAPWYLWASSYPLINYRRAITGLKSRGRRPRRATFPRCAPPISPSSKQGEGKDTNQHTRPGAKAPAHGGRKAGPRSRSHTPRVAGMVSLQRPHPSLAGNG